MSINQWIWGLPSISRQTRIWIFSRMIQDFAGDTWREKAQQNSADLTTACRGTLLRGLSLVLPAQAKGKTGEFTCDMMGISPIYTQQYNATTVKPRAPMTWPFLPHPGAGESLSKSSLRSTSISVRKLETISCIRVSNVSKMHFSDRHLMAIGDVWFPCILVISNESKQHPIIPDRLVALNKSTKTRQKAILRFTCWIMLIPKPAQTILKHLKPPHSGWLKHVKAPIE